MADEGGEMVHNLERQPKVRLLVPQQVHLQQHLHVIAYRSYRVRLKSQHA